MTTHELQMARRIGSSVVYSAESLDEIPQVIESAAIELKKTYDAMRQVSEMIVELKIEMKEPPDLLLTKFPVEKQANVTIDPALELTELEKWECTARWLNACYRSFPRQIEYDPCERCPIYEKKCHIQWNPPQVNFKVIERFTGPGTIVGINTDYGSL